MPTFIVLTRISIPEFRRVEGLEYGAYVSHAEWTGYYVRPADSGGAWGIARLTPASDELPGDGSDRAIVAAVRAALAAVAAGDAPDQVREAAHAAAWDVSED